MSHSKWNTEFEQRQRNLLPEDTIPNAAAVEGYIIRGDKRLTGVQRAGALVLGIVYSLPGLGGLVAAFLLLFGNDPSFSKWGKLLLSLGVLVISCGWLYISIRMMLNAIRGGGSKKHLRTSH